MDKLFFLAIVLFGIAVIIGYIKSRRLEAMLVEQRFIINEMKDIVNGKQDREL